MLKHQHLMISAEVKSPPADPQELKAWLVLLVKRIGMQIADSDDLIQNPQAYYCDKNGNRGMTGTVILETSNCTVHTWDEDSPAKFEFDLYSCADFDPEEVKDLIDIFKIIRYNSLLISRQNGLEIINQYTPSFQEKDNDTATSTTETSSRSSQKGTDADFTSPSSRTSSKTGNTSLIRQYADTSR